MGRHKSPSVQQRSPKLKLSKLKQSKLEEEDVDEEEHDVSARPKRKATNAHIFRYLQTGNPSRLEENDLKKALEASLEEHPDYWPEDSASCSSSDQSNANSASSNCSTGGAGAACNCKNRRLRLGSTKRKSKSSTMQQNHLNHINHHSHHYHHSHCSSQHYNDNHPSNLHANSNCTANHHCCPKSSVLNRYKPVAKKNIYDEADFFHDGIMEYIEYELLRAAGQRQKNRTQPKFA